ncbi:MAG: AgmX/PglI C-terminal domain-containing protein [Deltaproteobacteria bacterium]|nr:AgmX/PglI C-terminal domain-containing protein [Deltaproteobacteria bacterium]
MRTRKVFDGRAAKRGESHPRGLAVMALTLGGALVAHAIGVESTVSRRSSGTGFWEARRGSISAVLEFANAVARRETSTAVTGVKFDRALVQAARHPIKRHAATADSAADAFIIDVVRNLTRVVEGVDRGMIAARIDAALSSALGGASSRAESPVDDDLARLMTETGRRAEMATALASVRSIAAATRVSDTVAASVDLPRVAIRGLREAASNVDSMGGGAKTARGAVEIDLKSIDAGDAIRRRIKLSLGGVKACYERALKRNARLSGRYVIRFAIGDGGRVEDEGIDEDSVRDVEMAACVRAQVRRWRFAQKDAADAPIVAYGVSFAPDPAADWSPR